MGASWAGAKPNSSPRSTIMANLRSPTTLLTTFPALFRRLRVTESADADAARPFAQADPRPSKALPCLPHRSAASPSLVRSKLLCITTPISSRPMRGQSCDRTSQCGTDGADAGLPRLLAAWHSWSVVARDDMKALAGALLDGSGPRVPIGRPMVATTVRAHPPSWVRPAVPLCPLWL